MPKTDLSRVFPLLRALSVFAALAWAGEAAAQQTITKTISTSPDLIAAFAEADNNPANIYVLYLTWRKDANGSTVFWKPQSPITLTKGKVQVLGSNTHLYPDRYVFDGEGKRQLFIVNAAVGFQPTLLLSGITIQNGKSAAGGGAMEFRGAQHIQIQWCQIYGNKSNTLGGAIYAENVLTFYMVHSQIQSNLNGQYGSCGNGQMGGGGGLYIANTASAPTYAYIHWSTFYDNTACRGGAIMTGGQIELVMTNSSIVGNKAAQLGGGLYLTFSTAFSQLSFNTIAHNHAGTIATDASAYPRSGGGLVFSNYTGAKNWFGNVIASNFVDNRPSPGVAPTSRTDDCYVQAGARTGWAYNNAIGIMANCSQLGTLGAWGIGTEAVPFNAKIDGPSYTNNATGFSMYVSKPAVDSPLRGNFYSSGPGLTCPGDDELGTSRPTNGRCDVGAIQYKP